MAKYRDRMRSEADQHVSWCQIRGMFITGLFLSRIHSFGEQLMLGNILQEEDSVELLGVILVPVARSQAFSEKPGF